MLLTLVLLGLLIAIFVVVLTNDLVRQNTEQRQTAEALAKAKEALIGFAAGVDLAEVCFSPSTENNCVRPGDLPCPDINDDGSADAPCGNSNGSTGQDRRLGRLPWKTLGLPDLRDGDGERLWYAVSNNFKNNTRTQCINVGDTDCLNSETPGTITLQNSSGTIIHDGAELSPPSGLVAVVIAPGAVLQRQSAASPQDRSCSGGACNTAGVCTSSPASLTAKCNPLNYLDEVNGGEDNWKFTDKGNNDGDGFINGPVYFGDRLIVNDRILAIKHDDIMPVIERRVAKEAMNCLKAYSAVPQNKNRYPWAASIADSGAGNYGDTQYERLGRMPDAFTSSLLGILPASGTLGPIVAGLCASLFAPLCMTPAWPDHTATPSCRINQGPWWLNWKEEVFYGMAAGYKPEVNAIDLGLFSIVTGVPIPSGCPPANTNNCMVVNPPSTTADKRLVVIVAGRPLAGQPRGTVAQKGNIANYLESPNADNVPNAAVNFTFQQSTRSTTFNDTVEYQ